MPLVARYSVCKRPIRNTPRTQTWQRLSRAAQHAHRALRLPPSSFLCCCWQPRWPLPPYSPAAWAPAQTPRAGVIRTPYATPASVRSSAKQPYHGVQPLPLPCNEARACDSRPCFLRVGGGFGLGLAGLSCSRKARRLGRASSSRRPPQPRAAPLEPAGARVSKRRLACACRRSLHGRPGAELGCCCRLRRR